MFISNQLTNFEKNLGFSHLTFLAVYVRGPTISDSLSDDKKTRCLLLPVARNTGVIYFRHRSRVHKNDRSRQKTFHRVLYVFDLPSTFIIEYAYSLVSLQPLFQITRVYSCRCWTPGGSETPGSNPPESSRLASASLRIDRA